MRSEGLIAWVLRLAALSAVSGLALIALFIFLEGLPIIWRVGAGSFSFPATGSPAPGASASSP